MLGCGYECHMVGGPWIAENPDCPKHGRSSSNRDDREEEIRDILYRVWLRDLSADDGYDKIEALL